MISVDRGFSSTLRKWRREAGVSLEKLSDGLCSMSMLSMIESGKRGADKLLRNRLLGRLGVSEYTYEELLQTDEYGMWLTRQKIICALENGDIKATKELNTEYYRSLNSNNRLEKQFSLGIKAIIFEYENKSYEEIKDIFVEICKLSIPSLIVNPISITEYCLSHTEYYFFVEYLKYSSLADCNEKRIKNNIEVLFSMLDNHRNDALEISDKAKIYSKVVVILHQLIQKLSSTDYYITRLKAEALYAYENLRKTGRSYYLKELLEMLKIWYPDDKNYSICIGVLDAVNDEFGRGSVKIYDIEYLRETYAYSLGDIVRRRRKMFGLTQDDLAVGICDKRTINRIEKMECKAHSEIVRELLRRLRLPPDYLYTDVSTDCKNAIELVREFKKYAIGEDTEAQKSILTRIKGLIDVEKPINKQCLGKMEYDVLIRERKMSYEEIRSGFNSLLDFTLKGTDVYGAKEVFLTKTEKNIIQNMVIIERDKLRIFDDKKYGLLKRIIDEDYQTEVQKTTHFGEYAFLMDSIASWEGTDGNFDISNRISREIIEYGLKCQRLHNVHVNLYNLIWNEWKKSNAAEIQQDKLYSCIWLAYLCDMKKDMDFYKRKLISDDTNPVP